MSYESDLAQLAADVAKLHAIIHGGVTETVVTEGGTVKTAANAINQLQTVPQTLARLTLTDIWNFANSTDAKTIGGLQPGDVYRNGDILQIVSSSEVALTPTWYVDSVNGNNTTGDGSRSKPYQSLSKINSKALKPGDIVGLACGSSWLTETLYAQNGVAGNEIIFTSYGTGAQPILKSFNATNKSYCQLRGVKVTTSGDMVVLMTASYVTIEACTLISTSTGWHPNVCLKTNAHHNKILNNIIMCTTPAMNDAINLRANCDYNLIMGNTIYVAGTHGAIGMEGANDTTAAAWGTANYNVIKNNVAIGQLSAGNLFNICNNSNYNLFEGNLLYCDDSAYTTGHPPNSTHLTMMKMVCHDNIVRGNILRDSPNPETVGIDMQAYVYNTLGFVNQVYNNHFYGNLITRLAAGGACCVLSYNLGSETASTHNNTFKNNIIYNNGGKPWNSNLYGLYPEASKNTQLRVQTDRMDLVYDNYFINNLFYSSVSDTVIWLDGSSDVYKTVAQAQTDDPTHFHGNLSVDPQLNSTTFVPLAGSPVIDAGDYLTTIVEPTYVGTDKIGTVFTVVDAGYFCDGFGIIAADTIQVGSQRVQIKSINRSTNQIEVVSPITWHHQTKVSLVHNASAPDIGVYEFK